MRIEEIINPGYGWRLLKIGELTKNGDEYLESMAGWKTCDCGGVISEGWYPTRRKIDVGDGWDLIPEGAELAELDQFTKGYPIAGKDWNPISWTVGHKAACRISHETGFLAFRRRKPEPVKEPVNTCAAVEEKREWYWVGCAPSGLMTESQARKEAIRFAGGNSGASTVLRAVSTFEKKTAVEIVETKICSPQS
jgi:hypothetical protein